MKNNSYSESELHQEVPRMLDGMLAGLESLWTVKRALHTTMAYDFSLFNFISPHENMLSKILAFFLNPAEVHGQGNVFLKEFLRYFELSEALARVETGSQVTVRTETPTANNRRIDITISIGNNYWIGIENKNEAVDQPSQINDYVQDLKSKCHGEGYIVFYLSPNGDKPDKVSASTELVNEEGPTGKNRLRFISYRDDISRLSSKFEVLCRADNVRAFIREFSRFVNREFRGENAMGEPEYLTSYILKNPKLILIGPQLYNAQRKICQRYLDWLLRGLFKEYGAASSERPSVGGRTNFVEFSFSTNALVRWNGNLLDVKIQSEIDERSPANLTFRVGVWSTDQKLANLHTQYLEKHGAPEGGEFKENAAWKGGYCEYKLINAVVNDLEAHVLDNDEATSHSRLEPFIEKVQTYIERLKDCTP